ncbi:MAG: hypothetical protein IH588_20570 [Anaerolineales bacterium]|nr:hypothetical protein [Anaerolineales bacterium]
MSRKFFGLAGILILTLACGLSGPATPGQTGVETIVAATFEALTASAPTAPSGTPVSFQNISFVIPEGLADGATPELIPAMDESVGGPWGVAPQYISFTLTGYTGRQDNFFKAVVNMYPASEYASVNSWAGSSLTRLQALLASPATPLTNDNLPTVPFNGAAAQQYAAQAKFIPFNGGNGVSMISQYSQFPGPILKDNSFYHYEGLTSDGKYFVAALFPVNLPLQSTAENPNADGIIHPNDISDTASLTAYYQGITDKLNASSPDSFQPSLNQLDALIQSITVNTP